MPKYKLEDINQNPELMDKITDTPTYWNKFKEALNGGLPEVELEGLEYEAEQVEVGGDVKEETEVVQDVAEEERGAEEVQSEETAPQEQEEQEVGEEPAEGTDERIDEEPAEAEEKTEVEAETEEKNKFKIKYKFYGKEYEREVTEEDIRMAWQKSLKFPELEKEIEALRPRAELLEKYGMTEEQLEFAKKLYDGDQTAIKQLLKTTDTDPYTLDIEDVEAMKFSENTGTVEYPKEVVEKISNLRKTDPDAMTKIADMSEKIFPTCLVEAVNSDPAMVQVIYDSYVQGELEKTLLKVHERVIGDDDLRRRVDRNFSDFIKVYTEEAQRLGAVPSAGGSQGSPANQTSPSKTANVNQSAEKLKASATVRGATAGGTRKKAFDDMTPAEQAAYLDSLDFRSKEFQELKNKYRNKVYGR